MQRVELDTLAVERILFGHDGTHTCMSDEDMHTILS